LLGFSKNLIPQISRIGRNVVAFAGAKRAKSNPLWLLHKTKNQTDTAKATDSIKKVLDQKR
jgi:hypothetical protein